METPKKRIHIICPVRGVTVGQMLEMDAYAARLRAEGYQVHYPPDSVNQEDETGFNICLGHFNSMIEANEVHVFWDLSSKGSHFDLGMLFTMIYNPGFRVPPKLVLVKTFQEDGPGKSYVKVMQEIIRLQEEAEAHKPKLLPRSVNPGIHV